jgi:hypothetical protein
LHVACGVLYEEGYGASASDLDDDQFPSDIFTLGYPETPEGPADDVMFGFADKLAWFLGGGNYSVLDLHAVWDKNQPAEVGQQSLDEYLNLTYAIITGKEQVPLVRDPFFADYAGTSTSPLLFPSLFLFFPCFSFTSLHFSPSFYSLFPLLHFALSVFLSLFHFHFFLPFPINLIPLAISLDSVRRRCESGTFQEK